MAEYDEMLMSTLSDDPIDIKKDKKEISQEYPVVTKSDDGEDYVVLLDSFWETYHNVDKSSMSDEIKEKVEVFTVDGKEKLGIKYGTSTNNFEKAIDKISVSYYPEDDTYNVYTSGSEVSEIYKGISLPEDLKNRWFEAEDNIDMKAMSDSVDTATQQALFGI